VLGVTLKRIPALPVILPVDQARNEADCAPERAFEPVNSPISVCEFLDLHSHRSASPFQQRVSQANQALSIGIIASGKG